MKYATIFSSNRRRDREATPLTARRYLFIQTAADEEAVRKLAGPDCIRERLFDYEGSAMSAGIALEDDEDSDEEESQDEVGAPAVESSGASDAPRETNRLVVTSGC